MDTPARPSLAMPRPRRPRVVQETKDTGFVEQTLEVSDKNVILQLLVVNVGSLGGCCPYGMVCQRGGGCSPPAGVAYSQSCPASYYLCPSSVGYGCCHNDMGCAPSQCYTTAPVTVVTTSTFTTTPAGAAPITSVTTITTTSTPTMPSSLPTDPAHTKVYPSYIAKVQPTETVIPDSGALTTAQIAGIVAGSVGFLIIVLVTAYIIIRHLNNVVKVVETTNKSSSSKPRQPPMRQFRPTESEVDAMSVDPLMTSPRPSHRRNDSDTDLAWGTSSQDMGSGRRSTPSSFVKYHAVPTSGSTPERNGSLDDNYFDHNLGSGPRYSQQSSAHAGTARVSSDSNGTHHHGRNFSNASEASSDVGSNGARTPLVQELDATPYVPELPASPTVVESPASTRRRSSGGVSPMSRSSMTNTRRQSTGHNRDRSDSSATGAVTTTPLEVVSETAEIHGHYGPSDHIVGQTAAGLNRNSAAESEL
jgi:hypothetical protein